MGAQHSWPLAIGIHESSQDKPTFSGLHYAKDKNISSELLIAILPQQLTFSFFVGGGEQDLENGLAEGDVCISGCLHRAWRSTSDGRCSGSSSGFPVFNRALWFWKISPNSYLQDWPQVSITGAKMLVSKASISEHKVVSKFICDGHAGFSILGTAVQKNKFDHLWQLGQGKETSLPPSHFQVPGQII